MTMTSDVSLHIRRLFVVKSTTSPLDPAMFRDGRGAAVQPRPRLLLLPPGLVRVLLQPLREPLPVQVQRRLERLDPVPVAVVALLQLVGQLQLQMKIFALRVPTDPLNKL